MMARRPALAGMALVAMLALVPARPSAQQATEEELTSSPYTLLHGSLDVPERVARHERLAALAERAGDHARAARHFVIACAEQSQLVMDAKLSAASCNKARELAEQHGLIDVKVHLLTAPAWMRMVTFNFQGAIEAYEEAVALGKGVNPDLPDHGAILIAHHGLGFSLVEFGRYDEGRRHLMFARDHCRNAGNSVCAAFADMALCRFHAGLGDFVEARAACETARAEAAVGNDQRARVNLGWMVGTLEAFAGRPAASLAALQDAWQASDRRDTGGLRPILAQLIVDALIRLNRLEEAETWQQGLDQGLKDGRVPFFFGPQIAMRRGQIAARRGRLEEAEAAFTIASRSLIHEMAVRAGLAAAGMSVLRGNHDNARQALERAIARIERSRTNLAGSAMRASYLTLHANAYRSLAGLRFDTEGAAAAPAVFEIIEAGRARALRDSLASAQVAGEAAPPLKAADMQALLQPNQVLVEYVSTDFSLAAITVTRDRVTVTKLPLAGNGETLSRRVDFFHSLVQEGDESALDRPAQRLYEDVLAPALAEIPAGVDTLIVSPDGPLHRLPFDAIGTPRLIDRWDIVMVPSAAVLATREAAADRSQAALIVTASAGVPGLGPLAAAPEEADAIRNRIGGSIAELAGTSATRERLLAEGLDRFAVLHFASHAVVDEERPLRSALILAGPDGRWTAEDIYRQKLRADLVVLSACSTAAGTQTPGEGVMSLSRAFLHAGARATVATLWDVPDAPGPVFADVLYRRLAAGEPLGAAAAEARRELRRRGAPPRAWAAYVVTGNPGTRVEISPATNRRLLAAAVSGGFAVLLLIAALLMRRPSGESLRVRRIAMATASVGLAAVAIGVQGWPDPGLRNLRERSTSSRGDETGTLTPSIANGQVSWTATPAADEHLVELFDAQGTLAASTTVTTTTFDLPAEATGWIRVEARRTGQRLSRSALIPIAK